MLTDRYDLPISTSSAVARDAYISGVDRLLSAYPLAEESFEQALAEDHHFALAHIGRARALQVRGRAPEARSAAAKARELAQKATPRERTHVESIALMLDGDGPSALTLLQEHLHEFPRDAVVLSLALGAFGLLAFSGRADHEAAKLALCEALASHYGDDWWFLTFHGYSHTEAGNLEAGRKITEHALELRRENGHGAHAMAHSFFERGDTEGGIHFLEDWLPIYERSGSLQAHLVWHLALLKLATGDVATTLTLYRQDIAPAVSQAPPILTVSDGASLFWRMKLNDPSCALPTAELTEYVGEFLPHATHPFVDVHCVMAAALAGDNTLLVQRTEELERLNADGRLAPGDLIPMLCQILKAFANDDYETVISVLAPKLGEVVRFGGSKAQREVFEDTLVVAYLRAGRLEPARQLLNRRLERRPSPRDETWLTQTKHAP